MAGISLAQSKSAVARYIDLQLKAIEPKKAAAVADEAGFAQRNMLSMIRTGQTKLPFDRVARLAKALRVDTDNLFRMALGEYQPDIAKLLAQAGQEVTTKNERELLAIWRSATDGNDPPVEPIADKLREIGATARARAAAQSNAMTVHLAKGDH